MKNFSKTSPNNEIFQISRTAALLPIDLKGVQHCNYRLPLKDAPHTNSGSASTYGTFYSPQRSEQTARPSKQRPPFILLRLAFQALHAKFYMHSY